MRVFSFPCRHLALPPPLVSLEPNVTETEEEKDTDFVFNLACATDRIGLSVLKQQIRSLIVTWTNTEDRTDPAHVFKSAISSGGWLCVRLARRRTYRSRQKKWIDEHLEFKFHVLLIQHRWEYQIYWVPSLSGQRIDC